MWVIATPADPAKAEKLHKAAAPTRRRGPAKPAVELAFKLDGGGRRC
jgi:hypothetical protein